MLPLLLTWIFFTIGAFILLWGIALTAQAYLYEHVADRLPLRAAIGAIFLGCFYTFWIYANTRADSKDKYGVIQEFSPTARSESHEFTAVRQYPRTKGPDGKPREELVPFKKGGVGRNIFFVDAKNEKFRTNSSDYITVSLDVVDATGKTARFDAKMDALGNYDLPSGRTPRFIEAGGKRYVEADSPNLVFAPSTAALIGALAFNFMNFVIWVVAFWPCLRFTLGHSIGGAIVIGSLMMLFLVPLLFEKNQLPPVVPAIMPITDGTAKP